MNTETRIPSKLDKPEILRTIFSPRQDERTASPPLSHDHRIDIPEEGVSLGCRFHICDHDAPVILYFHGNGETVPDYDEVASEYTRAGMNLFVATYRGYGSSGGKPTVSALYYDNILISSYLKDYLKDYGYTGALFVMGRSLGSASAIDLMYRCPDDYKGLLLDSSFADTLPLAKRLGYDISDPSISEEDCFNNLGKIRKISNPTFIIHGSRDQIIPVAEAEKLQAESGAKTKQFHIIPGADHNSLITNGGSLYFETIKKFIDTVSGKNTWRQRRRTFKKRGTGDAK